MQPAIPRSQDTEVWVFIACCITFFLAGLNRRINEKKHDQSILGFLNFGLSRKTFATCVERTVTKSALLIHQLRK